jgi:hypothetical protein
MVWLNRGGFTSLQKNEDDGLERSDDDSEKGLLTDSPVSNLSQRSHLSYSSRKPEAQCTGSKSSAIIILSILNAILFGFSVLFLLSPLSKDLCQNRMSVQDEWKATSYYCTYSPFPHLNGNQNINWMLKSRHV